uniref:Uncharacterized protein n=1 Tax=Setaria italica TaxID=4555 RepID=K3Z1M0_SETIT
MFPLATRLCNLLLSRSEAGKIRLSARFCPHACGNYRVRDPMGS